MTTKDDDLFDPAGLDLSDLIDPDIFSFDSKDLDLSDLEAHIASLEPIDLTSLAFDPSELEALAWDPIDLELMDKSATTGPVLPFGLRPARPCRRWKWSWRASLKR